MKYGIGHLSVIPCRAEASDASEQVSQLLFGETIKVYEKKRTWYRIKTAHDAYEAWVDENQFQFISQSEFESINKTKPKLVADLISVMSGKMGDLMPVLLGSNLVNWKEGQCTFNEEKWTYEGAVLSSDQVGSKAQICEHAYLFLNSPYQWGGRSAFGIDCSGFVQVVYKLNGVFLPRDASQQAEMGQALSFIEEAEEGDLAFFDNEEGKITHVGIILSGNRIIHASGKVRIDKLDHQGIFNTDKRDYTHRLRLISKIY